MSTLHILSSLPHVPHFAKVARLPVGPAVHAARLAGLDAAATAALCEMRRRAWPERGVTAQAVALPAQAVALPPKAAVLPGAVAAWCAAVETQRQGLAALRVAAGRAKWPEGHAPIHRARLPAAMTAAAMALLAADDMRGLEHLRLEGMWTAAERQQALLGPGLAALLLAVARYDIADAWLAGDAGAAQVRLTALAGRLVEVAHG